MTINFKTAFFVIIGLLLAWLVYKTGAILTPFILAAVFAFVLDPVVNLLTFKSRLHRTASVAIVYVIILTFIAVAGIILTRQILNEATGLRNSLNGLSAVTRDQIHTLPDWLQPVARDTFLTIEHSQLLSFQSVFLYFPKAISQLLSLLIFLFCGFYFLKEGHDIIDRTVELVPRKNRQEINELLDKMYTVFGQYLRGQLFLIIFVSLALFIALTFLGAPYALILAIFSGIAEIIPLIGPIFAAAVAAFLVLLRGAEHTANPLQAAIYVLLIYFVVRQLQDYFVTPYVMGRVIRLHPLIVLFAVVAGGHIFGILGLLLAVPVTAMLKLILEYSIEKINEADLQTFKHKKS